MILCESRSVVSDSLRPHGLYSPWNSPGQNTGVGGLSLLQGIFPTQGQNAGLPHCRQILYQLSHKGSLQYENYSDEMQSSNCYFERNYYSPSISKSYCYTKQKQLVIARSEKAIGFHVFIMNLVTLLDFLTILSLSYSFITYNQNLTIL